MNVHYHFIAVGGGAAGFFGALAAKAKEPQAGVLILEKSTALLSKVRISGGGRCNVTHACFDPVILAKHYPRGNKALIGPFTRFQPRDTMEWFQSRGVDLKIETDGRVFPVSDNSQSIIDCLLTEAGRLGVEIRLKQSLTELKKEEDSFKLYLEGGGVLSCDKLLLATGSHPNGHAFARSFGHTIQPPIPSLFTFNVPTSPLKDLAGIAIQNGVVEIPEASLTQKGPILITHWGFSGPAVLKLSAWGARTFHENKYKLSMRINWVPSYTTEPCLDHLKKLRAESPSQTIMSANPFNLPKNLWKRFLVLTSIEGDVRLSEISNNSLAMLSQKLTADIYDIDGKTTYKEEFVTCGGVSLNEINFKTMESRLCPGLHFAGEILDIDGITGGFNFQNAWTTGWLAGNA